MKPLVERLKQEYDGRIEFRLLNVERDAEGVELARALGVQYVPTFVFVDKAGVVSTELVGEVAEERMREQLELLIK